MELSWVDELRKVVDPVRILTNTSDLYSYSYDASFGTYLPDVVVQVETAIEVSNVLKLANRERLPVYPRGAGTSLSGGPLPVQKGIVMDFSQWKNRLEIHPDDLVAVVSPGVVTSDINKAAGNYGLMYPPDPSSEHVSTIGGNLAENSGGPRGLKYGVTKDYVIGLEVVTPEGEIIRTGGKTFKNVTGYDLTKLIIGSEGTLGVITEAILKLIPKPPATMTMMAVFDDLALSGKAVSTILTSGILPSKIELLDKASMAAVENYQPIGLPTDAEAIILLELDGHEIAIRLEMDRVGKIMNEVGARKTVVAESDEEADQLWKARKLVSPAIAKIKPTKVSEDATVPRSKIPEMIERLKVIGQKFDVHLVVFGHAGDGNLHPNILCDIRDTEEMMRVEKAVSEIFDAALELGGTLSGEHGIGTMKAPFMKRELGAAGLEMMRRIKDAWDPNQILNPGKVFPSSDEEVLVLRNV